MKVIYPPIPNNDWSAYFVFLAGSIEMGKASDWQQWLIDSLSDLPDDLILMNPRRKDWNSSWEQTKDNVNFNNQVNWELDHIISGNLAAFYFDPATKAPITLMELGYTAGIGDNELVVCCPKGYWRRGNIEVFCEKQDIVLLDTLDGLSKYIRRKFNEEMQSWHDQIHYYQAKLADFKNGV